MNIRSILPRLKQFALAWEHWWTRESYPHLLGLVRIVVGGWLLFYWAIRLPNIEKLYSSNGMTFPLIPTYMPENLQWILDVQEPNVVMIIFMIHLIALAALTIGFFTRTSAAIAFVLSWYFYYIGQHHFHTSYDRLYMFSLLFLALSQAGEIYSIEAWQKYGNPLRWGKMISIFSQRMFAFQITMTYLGVGFQKLWLPGWQGGEMLYYSMIGVWGTPLGFKITSYGWNPLYHVAVNMIKMFECLIPFSFWIRKDYIRWFGMGSGLIFHILVHLLLYIWWFAVLIPAYVVFFSPEEFYAFVKKHKPELALDQGKN